MGFVDVRETELVEKHLRHDTRPMSFADVSEYAQTLRLITARKGDEVRNCRGISLEGSRVCQLRTRKARQTRPTACIVRFPVLMQNLSKKLGSFCTRSWNLRMTDWSRRVGQEKNLQLPASKIKYYIEQPVGSQRIEAEDGCQQLKWYDHTNLPPWYIGCTCEN